MHLLAAQPGAITDGEEAVDLGQSPGDMLFLSAADTELALLADAGHMFADFMALAMAWVAFRMARRPANWRFSFGFDRFQILVAFVNGLSLFAIAGWIFSDAARS